MKALNIVTYSNFRLRNALKIKSKRSKEPETNFSWKNVFVFSPNGRSIVVSVPIRNWNHMAWRFGLHFVCTICLFMPRLINMLVYRLNVWCVIHVNGPGGSVIFLWFICVSKVKTQVKRWFVCLQALLSDPTCMWTLSMNDILGPRARSQSSHK